VFGIALKLILLVVTNGFNHCKNMFERYCDHICIKKYTPQPAVPFILDFSLSSLDFFNASKPKAKPNFQTRYLP
jgi:hypothetical protein